MKTVLSVALSLGILAVGCPQQTPPGEPSLDHREPGKLCPVHGTPLVDDLVPIVYGLVKEKEKGAAREKQFPYATSSWLGGCKETPVRKARVSCCPQCRKAEAAWIAANPDAR